MRISLGLALVALTSTAFADAKRDSQLKTLRAAIDAGPDAVKAIASFPLVIAGLRFGDAECDKTFGRGRKVEEAELAPFVACVKATKPVVDRGVFVVDPGAELRVRFVGPKFGGLLSNGDNLEPPRAAKHLASVARPAPDADGKAAVAKKKVPFLAVDIYLCVNEQGEVEKASVERYSKVEAGVWADTLLEATKKTRYKPFTRQGTPARVCTHQLHVYPEAKRNAGIAELDRLAEEALDGEEGGVEGGVIGGGVYTDGVEGGVVGGVVGTSPGWAPGAPPPPPPPPPPAPPQNVAPSMLEQNRLSGSKEILPDSSSVVAIRNSGKTKIIGSYKLCIDTKGNASEVRQLKSTGFPAYDAQIQTEMRTWKYSPYQVNGKAVPVCTAVTFIYAQK